MVLKRIFAAIIAVSILFTAMVISAYAEEENKVQYETEISFLTKIAILDETFNADKEITRGDFAEYIIKIIHPEVNFETDDNRIIFNDVPADNYYYSIVKACSDLKIISGDSSNNFYPNNPIKVVEAITMLINALDYTPYAVAGGGYPTGYLAVAKSSGISKGLDFKEETVKGAVAAKLLYNALFADIVSVKDITESNINIEINQGKNILSERLDIKEYDALVIDNGVTALYGDSMNDLSKVVLQDFKNGDRVVALSLDTGIDSYVGARVKAFVKNNKETGNNEVIYFELHKNSKIATINSNSIINVQSDYIEYEIDKESNSSKKLIFSSSTPLVILNGQKCLDYDNRTFQPKDGILTLYDYDNNGKFDIVSIYSFNYYDGGVKGPARNIVVDIANEEDKFINCKFNPAMNLDLSSDKYGYKIVNSEAKSLGDISEYDIVSIAQALQPVDGKTFYFLFVSSQSEAIMVNSVSDNMFSDGEKELEVSDSILSVKKNYIKNLKTGNQVTACFDVTGKVAYIIESGSSGKMYGYLINAAISNKGQEAVNIKYLNKNGEVVTSELKSKVLIDGQVYTTAEKQLDAIKRRPEGGAFMADKDNSGKIVGPGDTETKPISRPIIYEIDNEGLITKIDTDTPNLPTTDENTAYSDQTFIKYSQDEIDKDDSLKAAYRSPRLAELKSKSSSIDGKFNFTSSTVVMCVPDIDTYGLERYKETAPDIQGQYSAAFNYKLIKLHEMEKTDDKYKVIRTADVKPVMAYDIQAYDIDQDTGVAGLLVIRGRDDVYWYQNMSYSASNPMYVFLEARDSYDANKEKSVKTIYYTKDGGAKMSAKIDLDDTYYAYRYLIEGSSTNPYNTKVEPLKKGDIIRVFQKDGYIEHLEKVLECANLKSAYSSGLYPTTPRGQYSVSSGGGVKVPCNLRYLFAGQTNTYVLGVWYPKSIKNGYLTAYMGLDSSTTNNGRLSNVDPSDTMTYTEQFLGLAGVPITVVTKDENGEIKIKEGNTSDILCYNETKDLRKTSILILKHTNYKLEQLLVYNGF